MTSSEHKYNVLKHALSHKYASKNLQKMYNETFKKIYMTDLSTLKRHVSDVDLCTDDVTMLPNIC